MFDMMARTNSGACEGYLADGLLYWKGIPYAKPPLGALRFKRAQKLPAWDGVLQANRVVDCSTQFDVMRGMCVGSEDCLYLNIIRPTEGERLPVLVWIHGGGFNTGGINEALTPGEPFARDGICFVEIQYRLNVLGFYDFSTYAGCEAMESNCGLSDQIAALAWIHENIASFGGDPERVTICGESAGASSVVNLMVAPAARGYFTQAIAESPLPNCVMTPTMARRNIDLFIEAMGWREKDLPRLCSMEPYDWLPGNEAVLRCAQEANPGIFLPGPVIDDLLPAWPMDAIAAGVAKDIRLLIGTNLHEGTMFVRDADTVFPNSWAMIETMLAANGCGDAFGRMQAYYDRPDSRYPEISPFVNFATDYAFRQPVIKLAEFQRQYANVWVYSYEFVAKLAREYGMLASHAFELAFVFASYRHELPWQTLSKEPAATLQDLTEEMHGAWSRFIKGEAPKGAAWPAFCGYCSKLRIFDKETTTQVRDYRPMMALWGDMRFYR